MTTFTGDITLSLGASESDKKDVTKLKKIRWREVHELTPKTTMNVKNALDFHQSHKFVEGEIHTLDPVEAHAAFHANGVTPVDYMPPALNHPKVPYFVATRKDSDGNNWLATFDNAYMVDVVFTYVDDETHTITVYRFVATKVTETPPA